MAYDNEGNRTCLGTASACTSNESYSYGYNQANSLTSWHRCTTGTCTSSDVHGALQYDGNGLLKIDDITISGNCPLNPSGPEGSAVSARRGHHRARRGLTGSYEVDNTLV